MRNSKIFMQIKYRRGINDKYRSWYEARFRGKEMVQRRIPNDEGGVLVSFARSILQSHQE